MLIPGRPLSRLALLLTAALLTWAPTVQAEPAIAAADTTTAAQTSADTTSGATAPVATTPADTTPSATTPADTTSAQLPIRVELADGSSYQASQVGPWPDGFILIVDTDGRTHTVPSFKVGSIVDARGRKFTRRVLDEHKTIPKGPPPASKQEPKQPEAPFRFTEPQLSGFVLQGGYFIRLDPHDSGTSGTMAQADIGYLKRIGDRHGIGATFFYSGNGDVQSSGLKLHGRARVGTNAVLDLAPGLILDTNDDASPANGLPGFVVDASVTFYRWIAIASQIEARAHETPDEGKTTDVSWYLGPRISFDTLPRLLVEGRKPATESATPATESYPPVAPDDQRSVSKKGPNSPLSGFSWQGSYMVRVSGSGEIRSGPYSKEVDRGVFQAEYGGLARTGEKWGLGASLLLGGNRNLSLFGVKARARRMIGAKTYVDVAPGYISESPTESAFPDTKGFVGEISLITHGWIGVTSQVQIANRKDSTGQSSAETWWYVGPKASGGKPGLFSALAAIVLLTAVQI